MTSNIKVKSFIFIRSAPPERSHFPPPHLISCRIVFEIYKDLNSPNFHNMFKVEHDCTLAEEVIDMQKLENSE